MNKVLKNKTAIILFILPAFILFTAIIVLPIIMSAFYSLQEWDGINNMKFIGIDNYKELFTNTEVNFPKSVGNALVLAVLSVVIQLPLSLALALALGKGYKGERFFLSLFFVPVIMSTVVIGQLWAKIYYPDDGILDVALRTLNLESWKNSVLGDNPTWLGNDVTALIAVFIPILWQYVGYHMLLMYAGIKSISPDLREAAKIDGANEGQVNRHIIIPLLKPILKICVIFAVTGSLKAFDLIYVLARGGPGTASAVPSTLMKSMIFDSGRYGFGSSIAISIIFLCFFFAIVIEKTLKTEVD